jgi:hypothetical protein
VDVITSPKTFTQQETQTMKFLPSLKSAKASILAALTIATAIASSVAPSPAHQSTRLISTPGKPDLVIANNTRIAGIENSTKPTSKPQANTNLIKNGNFSSGLSQWGAENSVAGVNRATMRQHSGQLLQGFRTTVGAKYRVSFDMLTDQSLVTMSMFLVSTFPLHSNVSFRLSDLRATKITETQYRFSFEITGADRRIGISETSVIDTLNFRNVAPFATFSITNVSIVPVS